MIDPCPRVIHWWDIDTDSRCIRAFHHAGDHTDGDRWWDGHGLRTPQDPPPAERPIPNRARDPRALLTDEQAVEIRRRAAAGQAKAGIARELNVSYNTVWAIVNHLTYRSAS